MLSSGLGDGEFPVAAFDALLELVQPKTYQCVSCHDGATYPERYMEEVDCWQCEELAAIIVGPEIEP